MDILGIDIGGSGIKGALVNVETGELSTARHRIPTPQPSEPKAVAGVVAQIAKHFKWKGPIGCTFPGVVKSGVIYTAANVDKSWVETDASKLFSKSTGCPVTILNDGDAAGMAEMTLGAGRNKKGVVMVLVVGTGIGSALFIDGILVPNTELGHLELDGYDAESRGRRPG